ncbi:MAG: undecaprenyl-diphosphate phosphatase [Candidatus Bathyarchaeia archaeon]
MIVGAAEGAAIIPGLSRSGLTIAAALLLGLKREKAFKFSFLLSIPAVVGAIGYTFCTEYDALKICGFGFNRNFCGRICSYGCQLFRIKDTVEDSGFWKISPFCSLLLVYWRLSNCT